jgi:hypothetical protein
MAPPELERLAFLGIPAPPARDPRNRRPPDAPLPPVPVTDAQLLLAYHYTRRALLELDVPRAVLPLGSPQFEAVTEAFIAIRAALDTLELGPLPPLPPLP